MAEINAGYVFIAIIWLGAYILIIGAVLLAVWKPK